jgi:hypothetical protein
MRATHIISAKLTNQKTRLLRGFGRTRQRHFTAANGTELRGTDSCFAPLRVSILGFKKGEIK